MGRLEKRFPVYSRLLRLYPAPYRQAYQRQMLQTLADMLHDPATSNASAWLRTGLDLPLSLGRQNLAYASHALAHETPDYVKRVSIAGSLLLLPFFIFLTLDAITAHSLYSSWFWQPWVIATWLIIMPAVAAALAGSTFLYWARAQRRSRTSVYDLRRNWPLLGIVVVSAGIVAMAFFHDSVHCVVHNPIKELRNWHTTWTCLRNG